MRQSFCLARFAGALMVGIVLAGGGRAGSLPPGGEVWPLTADQEPASSTVPSIPVVRRGRYTLVELVPEPAQRDLMRQVVEVSVPVGLDATVGDGLRHVLQRSGYRLCSTVGATVLYTLPLPASHLRLGPLMLRAALLTIAGPAWDLAIDDVTRVVCFARHPAPLSIPAEPASAPTSVMSTMAGASAPDDAREVRP